MRILFALFLLVSTASISNGQIDAAEAEISFIIKNAGIGVDGSFVEHSIQLTLNGEEFVGLSGTAEVSSIETGIGMRDRHLQKKGYFDVENHSQIILKSTDLLRKDESTLEGTFLLTMKGVEKEITFPVTIKREGKNVLLSGSFEINRIDFEVGSNSLTLSDEVVVNVSATFEVP